jgi:hypothetical protein
MSPLRPKAKNAVSIPNCPDPTHADDYIPAPFAITRRLIAVDMPGDRSFPGNEAASPDESRAAKRTSANG